LEGWRVVVSRKKRKLGYCLFAWKTIELSAFHLDVDTEAEIVDTIKHEVAHALAGLHSSHGSTWKALAQAIGAKPHAKAKSLSLSRYPWIANCGSCFRTYTRHLRPRLTRCKGCHSEIRWTSNRIR
jgi:predicted SprT family Zn-dependent metalloprotease